MNYKTAKRLQALRPVRDIISPSGKAGMKPRSAAYVNLVLSSKKKCNLFASFPSSGWNWCVDVMQYSLGKEINGEYNIRYDKDAPTFKAAERPPFNLFSPADSRAVNGSKVRSIFPSVDMDYCFHTHGYWGESPLLRMDAANHILIAREPTATLFSFYKKRRHSYGSFGDFLERSGALERMCHFYNSWMDFGSRNPHRMKVFTYELFRENPVEEFRNLARAAFGVCISENSVSDAVTFYSFENQKKREREFSPDESRHFHYKGQVSYREEMGAESYKAIYSYLEENLLFDPSSISSFKA